MKYSTVIKKSHLLSIICIPLLSMFIFAGIMAHHYTSEFQKEAQQLKTNALQTAKSELQQNIDILLAAAASDLNFCRNKEENTTQQSHADCDSQLVMAMLKNRILQGSPIPEKLGKISGLFNYGHGEQPIRYEISSSSLSHRNVTDSGSEQQLTPADFRAAVNKGELFFSSNGDSPAVENGSSNLLYAKYFQPLNWIVTAELNLDTVERHSALQSEKLHQQLYVQTVKNSVLIFIFLVFLSVVGFLFFLRTAKAVDLQDEMVAESAGKVRRMQARLKRSEKRKVKAAAKVALIGDVLAAADNVAIIILVENNNSLHIQEVSAGVEGLLGYSHDELVDNSAEILFQEGSEDLMLIYQEVQLSEAGLSGDLELTKKNGKVLQTRTSVHYHTDESSGASGIILVAVDISKLEETRRILDDTQTSLVEAHKMEAIGTLAGGIAHDFNNVLSSIVGYAELLKDQLDPDSLARRDLEQILRSTNRAAELVKQIVAFSRKKDKENTYFEPGLIIKETLKMLRSTLPATISIESDVVIDGTTIFTNTNRFHQLFMNLCTNAYQAMEHSGGTLRVKVLSVDKLENVPDQFQLEGEKFIELTVSDTGVGIAPQLKSRVFEPLFSTKGLNGRAGMGLCNAFHMVKMAGGAIWFEDRKQGGTNFYVVLPANIERNTNQHNLAEEKAEPQGSGNLLFVDDEPEIVDVSSKILESLGYQVKCCSSGEEALEFVQNNPQWLDLIITDQTMPGITGAELTGKVKEALPDIPIILCTGYSARISEENWSRYGVDAYVMKPFRRSDIAHLICNLLVREKSHKDKIDRLTRVN